MWTGFAVLGLSLLLATSFGGTYTCELLPRARLTIGSASRWPANQAAVLLEEHGFGHGVHVDRFDFARGDGMDGCGARFRVRRNLVDRALPQGSSCFSN